jgi:hypothetical protein
VGEVAPGALEVIEVSGVLIIVGDTNQTVEVIGEANNSELIEGISCVW